MTEGKNDAASSVPENQPSELFITNRTLRAGSQTYQISNLTRIGTNEVHRENKYLGAAKFFGAIVVICIAIALIGEQPAFFGGSVGSGFIAYKLYTSGELPTLYVFSLETNSGSTGVFSSQDRKFVEQLVSLVHQVMERDDERISYHVNIDQKTITDNSVSNVDNSVKVSDSQQVIAGPNNVVGAQVKA